MNFAFVGGTSVHWSPVAWTKRKFENYLKEEFGIEAELPETTEVAVHVTDTIHILPITDVATPAFNAKIERLAGPFYNFRAEDCDMYYTVEDMPIDAVRNMLIALTADERYKKEVSGTSVVINGVTIPITTARGARDIFGQGLLLGSDGAAWKFDGDLWVTLSNADLKTIVQAIMAKVQESFDWEKAKKAELDACVTLADLDKVEIVTPQAAPAVSV